MTLADRMRKLDTDQRPHALTEYCKAPAKIRLDLGDDLVNQRCPAR